MRTGIPHNTRTLPTLDAFLIENLRGPAMKLGCTVVSGYTPQLPVVSGRLEAVRRGVVLFEKDFNRGQMIAGPLSYKKPPRLPDNVVLIDENTTDRPIKTGIFIAFSDVGLECGTLDFVPGARIVGKLDVIKGFLKGRKFFVLSRWKDFICLDLA